MCALAYDVSELREPSLHLLELLLTAIGQLREEIQFLTGYLQSLAFSLALLLFYQLGDLFYEFALGLSFFVGGVLATVVEASAWGGFLGFGVVDCLHVDVDIGADS